MGCRPLEISANYYDDLEARFGLPADLAERMRAENVLYDRDEVGEYFQLYSPTFGEGFFFEIVERRGGYRGYGGPNAPFRLAAQKRTIAAKGLAGVCGCPLRRATALAHRRAYPARPQLVHTDHPAEGAPAPPHAQRA